MEETKKNIENNISGKEIISKIASITEFQTTINTHLIDGIDYGLTDPRSKKPELMKSGAEKVLQILNATAEFEMIDKYIDHSKGYFFYEFSCKILRNNEIIAIGYGSGNTQENKYKNQNPFTVANTALKIAKKRSFVDAVLTAGCLSNTFTQDTEDVFTKKTEEEINQKWLTIHLKNFFQKIKENEDLNTKKLENREFKSKFISKLGNVENWKDLNSYRVKKWVDKISNNSPEFVNRVKSVIDDVISEEIEENNKEME